MTNAELIKGGRIMEKELLIKALRYCRASTRYCRASTCCQFCPGDRKAWTVDECMDGLHNDAADALEAAEKRIEQLEKQVAAYQKLAKRCGKQMRKMERENDELQDKVREKVIMLIRTKEGYVDG